MRNIREHFLLSSSGKRDQYAREGLQGQSVAARAARTFLDRELALHTFLFMAPNGAVNLVGASLELHLQFGALTGLYFFGFLLDAFSLDLQRMDGIAGVHGDSDEFPMNFSEYLSKRTRPGSE